MQISIIISGFGGQGTLFAGLALAYGAMDAGRRVTWYPSYGPEMRGGTAGATVIISDEEIGSPVVLHPDAAIVLNIPSMHKYEPLMKAGGVLVYNSSLIPHTPQRSDVRFVAVPANEIAVQIGNVRVANLVAVGALAAATGILPVDGLVDAVGHHMPENRRAFVEPNQEALRRGGEVARQLATVGGTSPSVPPPEPVVPKHMRII
jgi:2-oxoglutarate ferredoxin oxidoreductase subunit gamma